MSRVAVIGAGSWGTAFAGLVASNADAVSLWCHSASSAEAINETRVNPRYLDGYELPGNVRATASLSEAVAGIDACVLALPSTHLTSAASRSAEPSRTSSPSLAACARGLALVTTPSRCS